MLDVILYSMEYDYIICIITEILYIPNQFQFDLKIGRGSWSSSLLGFLYLFQDFQLTSRISLLILEFSRISLLILEFFYDFSLILGFLGFSIVFWYFLGFFRFFYSLLMFFQCFLQFLYLLSFSLLSSRILLNILILTFHILHSSFIPIHSFYLIILNNLRCSNNFTM